MVTWFGMANGFFIAVHSVTAGVSDCSWLSLRFLLHGMVWLIVCFCRAIMFLVKAKTLAIKMVVWLGLWFWLHGLVWLMVY